MQSVVIAGALCDVPALSMGKWTDALSSSLPWVAKNLVSPTGEEHNTEVYWSYVFILERKNMHFVWSYAQNLWENDDKSPWKKSDA